MKNAINYYYNLIPSDIHHRNDVYYFDYNNSRYFLTQYFGEINNLTEIYNMHINLLKKGIYVHQIILNKDKQIITLINGEPYILLKCLYYEGLITFNNLLNFSNIGMHGSKLEMAPWSEMWSAKNDYLEYQLNQLGQKYTMLRDSFSYYIGLGETAIQITNSVTNKNITKTISHHRIKATDSLFDLYNPLNLIVDSRVRDAAEYFKYSFFEGKDITFELNNYLINSNLNNDEYLLFLARMLYPTYYFDLYENIISGKTDEKSIKKITNKVSDFENLIKYIYKYYKNKFNIMIIEWLET